MVNSISMLFRLYFLFVGCICFITHISSAQDIENSFLPNVILIMTDDQGYGDLSIHGNSYINTPVLDQFAREGVRLDRFYVSPLCAPTRASLLTGKYHPRTGTRWVSAGLENMRAEEITIAEVFQRQGYATGCFGKWHNGAHYPFHPNQQGFEEFIGFCSGHWYTYFNTTLQHNGAPFPTEGYITDVLTDEALAFIENHQEEPFFCYIPYNAPHGPFQVPDVYFDRNLAKLPIPEGQFTKKDSLNRRKTAAVYGMVENIDDNIGRILERLEKLSLRENTIVVFLTDNGPNGHRFNDDMRGIKGSIHEGGVRVPCFIQWPGVLSGGRFYEDRLAHIDVLPTLADLCGFPLSDSLNIDGMSAVPLLKGEKMPQLMERPIFSQNSAHTFKPSAGAIRTAKYRWTVEGSDKEGLFDMVSDPNQQANLLAEKPEIAQQLKDEYLTWFRQVESELQDQTALPIGLDGQEKIMLPAHESYFTEGIRFREGHGWAHDWITEWKSTDDSIFWKVDVFGGAHWQASIQYTTMNEDVGAGVELGFVKAENMELAPEESRRSTENMYKTLGTISESFHPAEIIGIDRIPRIETYEKEWKRVDIGTIYIPEGIETLYMVATYIPGKEVGHLKGLILEKVDK